MNKYLKIFFAFSLLIITKNTYAECTYTDKANLNKLAANVKIDYEKGKTVLKPDEEVDAPEVYEPFLNLIITNVSKELYVTGTEKNSDEEIYVGVNDMTDGKWSKKLEDVSFIRKYTFKIYGSDESACPGDALKTINVTLPMFNEYYATQCGDDDKDFYLCQEYITTNVSYEDFVKKHDAFVEDKIDNNGEVKKTKKWYTSTLEFLDNYKYYIIGGVAIIGASLIVVKVIKTKKQRELGL